MKKLHVFLLPLFILFTFGGIVGCGGASTDDNDSSDEVIIPDFHYKNKDFYEYNFSDDINEENFLLIEGVPHEGFPQHLLIPGGYRHPGFDMGSYSYDGKANYNIVVITSGGADDGEDITKWYVSELENRGWTIDKLHIGSPDDDFYWNLFHFSDANWTGQVEINCKDTETQQKPLHIFREADEKLDLLFQISVKEK